VQHCQPCPGRPANGLLERLEVSPPRRVRPASRNTVQACESLHVCSVPRSAESRRYERGPMIVTSNQSFGAWGDVFGDRVIATAILDRILHHAITINVRGNS
jgi:hypothetical protein